MLQKIRQLFTKKDREIIHDLAAKPKARKRAYAVWKCIKCAEEYYYKSLRCPICASDVVETKKFTTFIEYPLTRYVEGNLEGTP